MNFLRQENSFQDLWELLAVIASVVALLLAMERLARRNAGWERLTALRACA
jgi:hypothetical protein